VNVIPAPTGAGVYELRDAVGDGVGVVGSGVAPLAVGIVVSFAVAHASIAWVLRFVVQHNFVACE
jgi:undecaprenyl-diphosphatase